MSQNTDKQQNFMVGAFILVLSNIIVKVIGAVFKIPLMAIIGEKSYGMFTSAYNVYSWIFVVATAGLPVAVSKMVAESRAMGRTREVSRILRVVLSVFSVVGLAGSLLLFFGAGTFSEAVRNPQAKEAIMAVAPAIFFVCIMATFRGYFQGQMNMVPTSVSQIIEALCKLIIGLGAAWWLIGAGYSSSIVVAGAISGVTVGSMLGAVALIIIKKRNPVVVPPGAVDHSVSSSGTLLKRFISIAIPITIGASVVNLTALIDNFIVLDRLKANLGQLLNGIPFDRFYSVVTAAMPKYEAAVSAVIADPEVISIPTAIDAFSNILWGAYSGMALNLFTLPTALITAISISVLPAVSSAFVKKDMGSVSNTVESSMRMVAILSLPISAGFFVLSGQILRLLFSNNPIGADIAEPLLRSLSVGVIFICLVSLTNSLLQAAGKVYTPVVNMLVGGVVKFLANWFLIGNPNINISGTPIGTVLCYGVITVLNLIAIFKTVKLSTGMFGIIFKPLVCSVGMGVMVFFAYRSMDLLIGGHIATVLAILVGVAVYFAGLIGIRYLRREDVLLLPKGDKLVLMLARWL